MIENPYIFLQKKSFTTTLNNYLMHSRTPCFIVNHFAHIYFIAEITKKTSFIVKKTEKTQSAFHLLSPQNAISYMGVRWWLSFIRKTTLLLPKHTITDILDCYDHAGFAMAALRMGQKHIVFKSTSKQFITLKNRAHSMNANILDTKPDAFNLLELKFKLNNLSR